MNVCDYILTADKHTSYQLLLHSYVYRMNGACDECIQMYDSSPLEIAFVCVCDCILL